MIWSNKMPQSLEAGRMSVSVMEALRWVHGIAVSLLLLPWAPCKGSVPTVTAVLHGTAVLPCSVPFISGTEDLMVSWVKKIGTKPSLVLLAFIEGQFDLRHQAPQYRGRTNMSPDLSNGRLDLTLTHVEHRDEGVYVCQVVNTADYRDIEVGLSVIVPVSDPLLSVSCCPDGSAEISCWAENGSDLSYSLSVNGRIKMKDFHSSVSGSGVSITVSSAAPWDISCSVRNRISERNSSLISESCAESGASGGDRGLYWIWISVGLLCTAGVLLGCLCCCFYLQRCSPAKEVNGVGIKAVSLMITAPDDLHAALPGCCVHLPKPGTKVVTVMRRSSSRGEMRRSAAL